VQFSLSGGIKPISAVSGAVAKQIRSHLRKQHIRNSATPLTGEHVAAMMIASLTPKSGGKLLRYVASPDFDQICFQYSLHRRLNLGAKHKQSEDIRTSVRHQILEGLRHFTDLEAHDRTIVADLLIRDIITSAEEVVPALRNIPDETEVAAVAQAIAVGVRNGRMLGEISNLGAVHDFSLRMRAQVRNVLSEMPLPHVRGARSVPYAQLWVEPRCRELAPAGQDLDDRAVGRPLFDGRNVLLGAPGAGKSTIARKVTYDLALVEDEHQGPVPFLVVLRNFADKLNDVGYTLEEFIALQCAEPYGLKPPPHAIPYLLQNGRAVVILDGLDELTRVSVRRRVVDLIEGFAFNFPSASILVTSRKVGYEYAPLPAALFSRWELAPFDDDRVERYAAKWFILDASTTRNSADRSRSDRLAAFLRESESIRDIRSNALMLSLLCGLYVAEHFIPANRADVYRRCAELLFAQWDTMREIVDHEQSVLAARTALQYVAWTIFRETTDGQIHRTSLVARLRRHFAERADDDIAYTKADKFLEVCAGRSWVLAEVGSTSYEPIFAFVHRSFLEYFAAEYLSVRGTTVEDLLAEIGDRISSGEWPEVTHLAVQLHVLSKRGSDSFAELLLGPRAHGPHAVHALTFICRMLSYTGFTPALLRSIVGDAVAMLLDHQQGATTSSDPLEINPVRAILCESSPENLEMARRALAEALKREQRHRPSEVLIFAASIERIVSDCSRGRRYYWKRFADGVLGGLPRFDVAAPDRSRRTLLIWQAQRDFGAARELLATDGVTDLYSSIRLRTAAYPSPSVGLLDRDDWVARDDDEADAVTAALLGLPLPWVDLVPPVSFSRALGVLATMDPARMPAPELMVKTLLSLPFLEWLMRSDKRSILAIDSVEAVHRNLLLRARTDGGVGAVPGVLRRDCAPAFVAFVEGWITGDVSTVAAQPSRQRSPAR
jgi:hypothetical protein